MWGESRWPEATDGQRHVVADSFRLPFTTKLPSRATARAKWARVAAIYCPKISFCSEISRSSSPSMPRYLTVESSLNVRAAAVLHGGSWCARRSASPLYEASSACRTPKVKSEFFDPAFKDSGVLPGPQVG